PRHIRAEPRRLLERGGQSDGVTPPYLRLGQSGQQANRRAPQPGYKKRCDLMQGVRALALAEPSGPNLSLLVAGKTSPPHLAACRADEASAWSRLDVTENAVTGQPVAIPEESQVFDGLACTEHGDRLFNFPHLNGACLQREHLA